MNRFGSKNLILILLCAFAAAAGNGCAELQKAPTEPFYGNTAAPRAKEFRWANGESPKTFDPALAKSPAEVQAVRAMSEGLTEWDAKTLHPVPAAAESWESSDDFRVWTFRLRPDVRWSNNQPLVAADFARSWKRLAEMGEKSPHSILLSSIVGYKQLQKTQAELETQSKAAAKPVAERVNPAQTDEAPLPPAENVLVEYPESWFGVEAVDIHTLRVWLTDSDADFPKLAAHSALRPVHEKADFDKPESVAKISTNGAFKFVSADKNGVVFERSKNYWNAAAVKLERLKFVNLKSEEAALAAYQAGDVDAVTNANFEPLALKLLASYQDFRRTTYNAVTFYEFNKERPHLQDRRVREALAIAIDRERLTKDEMDGASVPADKYLPASARTAFQLDFERAKNLLKDAGYPNGKNFPKIKLLVNRNETQQRIAKAVAAGWRKNLGVETEIVVSSMDELEEKTTAKDFDLVRRVVVLPTTDEKASLLAMFGRRQIVGETKTPEVSPTPQFPLVLPTPRLMDEEEVAPPPHNSKPEDKNNALQAPNDVAVTTDLNEAANYEDDQLIKSEAQAIELLPAIPLYFPSSYTLVKPYVTGFDANLLDAHTLQKIEIQENWQPPASGGE